MHLCNVNENECEIWGLQSSGYKECHLLEHTRWMQQVHLKCCYTSTSTWHHIPNDQLKHSYEVGSHLKNTIHNVWQKPHNTSSNIFLGFGWAVDFFLLLTVAALCGPPAPLAIVSWFSATMAFEGGCPPVMHTIKSWHYPICCSCETTQWNKNICLSPRPNIVSRS